MEGVNEALKLIAQAMEMLRNYEDNTLVINILQQATDKLVSV